MFTVTDLAAKKVKEYFAELGKPNAALRVKIEAAGCAGLQYDLGPEEQKAQDDQVYESNGITIYIDPQSDPFLDNSQLDYVDSLHESGFKVNNPNSKSSCGCGQSFGV